MWRKSSVPLPTPISLCHSAAKPSPSAAAARAEEPTLCRSGLTVTDASWGLNEFCSPCSHWPEQVNEGKHRLAPGLLAPAVRDFHESDAKSADAKGSGAKPASPTQGGYHLFARQRLHRCSRDFVLPRDQTRRGDCDPRRPHPDSWLE